MYVGTYSPMARIFYESEEGLSDTLYIPSDDSFSDRCQILLLKSTNLIIIRRNLMMRCQMVSDGLSDI